MARVLFFNKFIEKRETALNEMLKTEFYRLELFFDILVTMVKDQAILTKIYNDLLNLKLDYYENYDSILIKLKSNFSRFPEIIKFIELAKMQADLAKEKDLDPDY